LVACDFSFLFLLSFDDFIDVQVPGVDDDDALAALEELLLPLDLPT